jgi:hypothetical protein
MVEELRRAVRACSGLRFRRGTSLVTTAQLSTACFVLLSRVVGGGGVVCRVCLFLFGVCLCGGVCFGVLCTNCYSFLNDIAVLLLLLKKTKPSPPHPSRAPPLRPSQDQPERREKGKEVRSRWDPPVPISTSQELPATTTGGARRRRKCRSSPPPPPEELVVIASAPPPPPEELAIAVDAGAPCHHHRRSSNHRS